MWEPDYVTTAEYKEWARITDDTDDTAIVRAITSASRAIDRYVSQNVPRQFGSTDGVETRYYTPRWDCEQMRWVIEVDDIDPTFADNLELMIDTSNSENYNQSVTSFVMRDRNAASNNRVFTQISVLNTESNQPTSFVDSAKVTVRWGWASFPTVVVEGCLLQTNRIHKRRTAVFSSAGSPEKKTQSTINQIDRLDEDIQAMLEDYVKLEWTI